MDLQKRLSSLASRQDGSNHSVTPLQTLYSGVVRQPISDRHFWRTHFSIFKKTVASTRTLTRYERMTTKRQVFSGRNSNRERRVLFLDDSVRPTRTFNRSLRRKKIQNSASWCGNSSFQKKMKSFTSWTTRPRNRG